ncbi:NUDIX hydrolase [Spirillospora sp. NPDC047279]|uniref:NUDIX hydrolase n=1 Tax=Spirillospora sp. NPDC047279 TaxID=3155478 RepID=UPI00340130BD
MNGIARPRAAAGVLFYDERDRILLVVPCYKPYREIPGGGIEPGETPMEAATREVREELGISPPIGRLLVTDWGTRQATDGNRASDGMVSFIFDGGRLDAADRARIRLQPEELLDYAFHDVARIHELTIHRLARRITHAHAARQHGTCGYLEHGEPLC